MLKKLLRRIAGKGRREASAEDAARAAGLDDETIETARQLVYERRLKEAVNAKWKPNRKGAAISNDEFLDALRSMKPGASEIMRRVFARTVEDTVLANRFVDRDGNRVGHLTVRKAAAMDGLRDLDDDVAVAGAAASPMNPEGRFSVPTSASGCHQFAERFSEAMNPVRNGRFNCVIPELVLEHFANYSTFIGYSLCELIGTHPTVSNACSIPGEDAIAPGYSLAFVDSDDLNKNGVPDDIEAAEMGGVRRSLGRLAAMEGLKEAISALAEPKGGAANAARPADGGCAADAASLDALARALERLAAYEEWERTYGAGEDSAKAVNEGFVQPVSAAFERFSARPDADSRRDALSALSLALADLSEREHPSLPEVRSNAARRVAVRAVSVAYAALTKPPEDFDLTNALNALAVAVERVGAYERYSDRNAEALSALSMALTDLSARCNDTIIDTTDATSAVSRVRTAMDEGDFDFDDPSDEPSLDGVSVPTEEALAAAQAANADKEALAEQKLEGGRVAKEQERQDKAAEAAQLQAEQAQQAEEAKQQAAEEAKRKEEEEREKKRKAAEIAKARQKYLDSWKQRADDMGLNDVCMRLAKNARLFGIGIAVPVVDGADYEQPLSLDAIREGSYRGFVVIEPTWIYPEVSSEDLVNPLSQSFFEPVYWAATGSTNIGNLGIRRIHRSWMIVVRNKELPNMLRPMYYYGGVPLTQEIYEAVFCADKVMNEVPKLAMTKRTTVVKGDPNDMVTNPEGVVDRLRAFSQVQDNFGILYVGRNADVQKLETSLSEFDQLISKCNQRVAAIAGMPESKLFKAQLAGSFQTGAYEMRDYWSLLMRIQRNWYTPLLSLHYKLDTKSRTGKVIDLKITFNSPDVPTDAERDESEGRSVQTINAAVQGGWLSPEEARTIARSREGSMFSAISAEMPEELAQAQKGQGQPPGAEGGADGGMAGLPGLPGGAEGLAGLPGLPGVLGGGGADAGKGEKTPSLEKRPDAGKPSDGKAEKAPSAPTIASIPKP